MMSAILRSSSRFTRVANTQRCRSFASSSVVRKDIVQELYLQELRTYKPAPTAKDAHVGVVKPFSAVKPPTPPSAPVDLASELAKYDAEEPTLAPTSPVKQATGEISDDSGSGAKEFLAFLEADLPKPDAHHH